MVATVRRIAIVGPESSGKTTLAEAVTAELIRGQIKARWVPEYAREYYRDRPYRPHSHDVLAIARGQLAAEQKAAAAADILICDSTVTTCKIWSQVAFGSVAPAILELDHPRSYDLTVLVQPDIPWEPDPLRNCQFLRDRLFVLYQRELAAYELQWIEVAGSHKRRFEYMLQTVYTRVLHGA